mgnify:CR=1 FL=1
MTLADLSIKRPTFITCIIVLMVAAGLVGQQTQRVKVILSGTIDKAVNLKGLAVTKGARAAIEAAGGSVA